MGALAVVTACSGGGGSGTATTAASAARQQGALAAARACRMWTEVMVDAVKQEPITPTKAAPLDARSTQIATIANQASSADPAWDSLSTDVAGATDFASAALPDINSRIVNDCQKVPSDAEKTVAAQPDPFATTTTAP
ncbi:MAG TPA: hypothetical protein VMU14_11095 [Acidimicrobiales bacterium]|nr:hypothetical protein [Acidimicrobiales bacterium]